jgi:predicted RNA-binding Zn-ribbon protein involved in translation (DUF1610 family)
MKFKCPKCERTVSTRAGIVLIGQHEKSRSLFVFDTRLGSYEHEVADPVDVPPGTVWDFFCPVCGADLTSKHSKRLAGLTMTVGDTTRRVMFSKVSSEHATFVLGGEGLEKHGEDSESYLEQ